MDEFINKLSRRLQQPLPGEEAHSEMMAYLRISAAEARMTHQPRMSAVMVLLFEKQGTISTVVIRRSEYAGPHSGQISFPGGKMDEGDITLADTALRETEEEIGIAAQSIRLIGPLTEVYIPPSNFIAQPFLAWLDTPFTFIPHEREVKEVLTIPLDDLFADTSRTTRDIFLPVYNISVNAPCFVTGEHIIWGATALILNELRHVYRELIT